MIGAVIAVSCVFLAALLGFLGWLAQSMSTLAKEMAVMNQGASLGAQSLIRALAARTEILEDVAEQYGERLQVHNFRLELLRNARGLDIPQPLWENGH